jgi:predicted enzyme related to lactoylglutathione lyase
VTDVIAAVLVHVSDVQAALSWYASVFPSAHRIHIGHPEFACLRIGSVQLEIVPADEKVAAGPAGSIVYWRVDDVVQARKHFLELGATSYRGPLAIEDGQWMCQVRDPWGNCIGLRGPSMT